MEKTKKKTIVITCIIAVILVLIAIITTITILTIQKEKRQNTVPTIALIGAETVELNLNETYEETGAKAYIEDEDKSNLILTEGEVDTSKPGEYKLKYIVTNEKKTQANTVERNVIVKDNIPPTIELKGKTQITIYKNAKYEEPGYIAKDNCDGDITNKVTVNGIVDNSKVGEYELTYSVEDSYNNKAEMKRKIIVKEKPVVQTTDSSSNTNSTNKLNTKVRGIPVLMYHFFYDASKGQSGRDNNWMEISSFEEQMKYLSDNNYYFPSWEEVEKFIDGKGKLPEKSVVITIDDGDQTFIDLAIPVIEKYNVKATSFVVTSWNGTWLPKTYKSSHMDFQSHSHDSHRAGANGKGRLINMSYEEAVQDVTKSKTIIGNCKVFCYPFGHYNDTSIQALKDSGYTLAFTTKEGRVYPGANKFALPRIRMSKGVSLNSFIEKVK
jgi:peptidoglycan/xylan/chitin deacetylase (PgdA/CDA1 family)